MTESLFVDEVPRPASSGGAYRVLARKYRPQTFAQLIGQDAMVRTLGNAIKRGRLAHAFLLTGVRGVGKTSTARLIAKALNCIGPDGQGGPTIDPCGVCTPCTTIAEGRNMDVIEIDAASNTGIDNIREIIDNVRYAAVGARYKIYIIDEVHMLSKSAFNALLKTLEEPPPHVKFLFATTEVDKVPVTVLSRCQRFDLRRIPADLLARHFAQVVEAEGVEAEPEALTLIARAAEGSVRDGLSILDQAIAHADLEGVGRVLAEQVREMLGLSDRGAVARLFGLLLGGDAKGALDALAEQHALGVDPAAVLRALLEIIHDVTVRKVGAGDRDALSAEEREERERWAGSLSYAVLHRLWQMTLKGHDEVAQAVDPREAADMAILRIVHASQLPDPSELARRLADGGTVVAAPAALPPPSSTPGDFRGLIAALEAKGRHQLAQRLHDHVGLVAYAPPELVLRPLRPLEADFARTLALALKAVDGATWRVELSDADGPTSLREQELQSEQAARAAVLATPVVSALLDRFPDAELVGWTQHGSALS